MRPANDGPGVGRALAGVPTQDFTGPRTTPAASCRWCGGAALWSWSLEDDAWTDGATWPPAGECLVCEDCQALTLNRDDAALLDRVMASFAGRVPYPYAAAFVREQEAGRLAHWIARRTTFRPC